MSPSPPDAKQVLTRFYEAIRRRDLAAARGCLADDMTFIGLFETYPSADAYMKTFEQLLGIVTDLEVKVLIGEGDDAFVFFELETTAPAAARTLVAEWHETRNGRIVRARSAFDGRPFAAMFAAPGG
ncbi:MAG TPA: nuclear transport factor 2 family protein [Myxococcaceae bacterium]|nr:nuclear transport factor 2 family protein [Myxococcaceae bacterium]